MAQGGSKSTFIVPKRVEKRRKLTKVSTTSPSLTILGMSHPRCRHKILFTVKNIIHKRISFKELTKNDRKMKQKSENFYQPKGDTFGSVV
jgi:hypothetical protein